MVQNTIGYPWASRREGLEGLISPLAVAVGLWGGMSLQAWQVVPVISHSADALQGIVPVSQRWQRKLPRSSAVTG